MKIKYQEPFNFSKSEPKTIDMFEERICHIFNAKHIEVRQRISPNTYVFAENKELKIAFEYTLSHAKLIVIVKEYNEKIESEIVTKLRKVNNDWAEYQKVS
jgi:hypothetical protein